jgi:hypothetical protein
MDCLDVGRDEKRALYRVECLQPASATLPFGNQ